VRRAVVVALLAMLVLPASAHAAFPGHNGKIAFSSNADGDDEIYTINPDGTGLAQLTHNTVPDRQP
jgi:Tol biopolymer transport system component